VKGQHGVSSSYLAIMAAILAWSLLYCCRVLSNDGSLETTWKLDSHRAGIRSAVILAITKHIVTVYCPVRARALRCRRSLPNIVRQQHRLRHYELLHPPNRDYHKDCNGTHVRCQPWEGNSTCSVPVPCRHRFSLTHNWHCYSTKVANTRETGSLLLYDWIGFNT
jgi:hypothetical protein